MCFWRRFPSPPPPLSLLSLSLSLSLLYSLSLSLPLSLSISLQRYIPHAPAHPTSLPISISVCMSNWKAASNPAAIQTTKIVRIFLCTILNCKIAECRMPWLAEMMLRKEWSFRPPLSSGAHQSGYAQYLAETRYFQDHFCQTTTLDKKKNHHRDSRREERCSIVWYHARWRTISAGQKSRTLSRMTLPALIVRHRAWYLKIEQRSSRRWISGMVLFFWPG